MEHESKVRLKTQLYAITREPVLKDYTVDNQVLYWTEPMHPQRILLVELLLVEHINEIQTTDYIELPEPTTTLPQYVLLNLNRKCTGCKPEKKSAIETQLEQIAPRQLRMDYYSPNSTMHWEMPITQGRIGLIRLIMSNYIQSIVVADSPKELVNAQITLDLS